MKKQNKMDSKTKDELQGNKAVVILRSAVENTNEGFVTIDSNHKVIFFNKTAEKIFGYRQDEIIDHDTLISLWRLPAVEVIVRR